MNSRQKTCSIREYLAKPDFVQGFREAWRGHPPDYESRTRVQECATYEIGRQFSIWMRAQGYGGRRPPHIGPRQLRRMAMHTGLPKIVGWNA